MDNSHPGSFNDVDERMAASPDGAKDTAPILAAALGQLSALIKPPLEQALSQAWEAGRSEGLRLALQQSIQLFQDWLVADGHAPKRLETVEREHVNTINTLDFYFAEDRRREAARRDLESA